MELAAFLLFLGAVFTGYVALIWLAWVARLARTRQDTSPALAPLMRDPVAADPLALALARTWSADREAALLATLEVA